MTLTQIIFEKQKKSETPVPITTLRHIIQHGDGSFSSFLAKGADSAQGEIIRTLEGQLKDLSTKLSDLETKSGMLPGRDSSASATKNAEV